MATQQRVSRPWGGLTAFSVIVAAIYAIVAGGWIWDEAEWSPGLALDLEGGTQIILEPEPQEGAEGQVTGEQVDQAVEIIRQRVNGSGVSEAEVTRQGSENILVSLPGEPDPATRDLVAQSAQLTFRPVLITGQGFQLPQPEATGEPTAEPTADPTGEPTGDPGADGTSEPTGDPAAETAPETDAASPGDPPTVENAEEQPLRLAAAAPDDAASPADPPTGAPDATAPDTAAPEAAETEAVPTDEALEPLPLPSPTDGSDLAWITPELQQEFLELDCLEEGAVAGGFQADPDQPLVTCSADAVEKYVLGPVEVLGENVADASGVLEANQQGFTTGRWVVQLEFDGTGTEQFSDITRRLAAFGDGTDQNRFAIVLDNVVVSAPGVNETIVGGQAEISGDFTQESAETLANQLRFGALPLSFVVQTEEQISATLGTEQLERGILAGVIGLGLVVVYSLIQYRALGLVTIASLLVAALITYGLLLFLSWRQGYRLSLPGVAGLIVAIGITADSFIVFFERIRDEIRSGRTVATAVEVGWRRASRTIIASDTVSMIAAVVLFFLAVGGVRGFAFTLGLTTIVDLLVVFLFTKPLVTLLSRTRFFGSGHKLSGFDPEHLGSVVARNAIRSGARGRPPAAELPPDGPPRTRTTGTATGAVV